MENVLEATQLSKNYRSVKALQNLSLTVESGSIFGLLGPNGSGKTTCLAILLGVVKPDSGTFSWLGQQPSHSIRRQHIAALLETPNFYPYLSGAQNLRLTARIKQAGEENIDTALQTTGLFNRRNSKFSTYSLGMKQRLAIAATLLTNPDVLVLDEPTNGLDPQGIAEIRELIVEIGKKGKTIILASHLLDEVEKVCTHVAVLKSGELLASGKVAEVTGSDSRVEIAAENLDELERHAKAIIGLINYEREKDRLILQLPEPADAAAINRYFFEKGVTLRLLTVKRRSLESQFLELTRKS